MGLSRLRRISVAVWRRSSHDDLLMLASSPAYAAVFSVFPLLIMVITLLSLIVPPQEAQAAVLRALTPYLPEQSLLLVGETLESVVRTRGTAGFIGVLGLLWGASAVAGSLRHALNRVVGGSPRAYWRRKLADLALVLTAGLFLSLSVMWSAALAALPVRPVAVLSRWLGDERVARIAAVAGPVIFTAAALFIAYQFLPHVRTRHGSLLWSTAVAVVLFEALKRGFVWYLRIARYMRSAASYPLVSGPLAGFVVFMIWVYLVAVIILFGAEVLIVLERQEWEASDAA